MVRIFDCVENLPCDEELLYERHLDVKMDIFRFVLGAILLIWILVEHCRRGKGMPDYQMATLVVDKEVEHVLKSVLEKAEQVISKLEPNVEEGKAKREAKYQLEELKTREVKLRNFLDQYKTNDNEEQLDELFQQSQSDLDVKSTEPLAPSQAPSHVKYVSISRLCSEGHMYAVLLMWCTIGAFAVMQSAFEFAHNLDKLGSKKRSNCVLIFGYISFAGAMFTGLFSVTDGRKLGPSGYEHGWGYYLHLLGTIAHIVGLVVMSIVYYHTSGAALVFLASSIFFMFIFCGLAWAIPRKKSLACCKKSLACCSMLSCCSILPDREGVTFAAEALSFTCMYICLAILVGQSHYCD
eukprot:g28287.t1